MKLTDFVPLAAAVLASTVLAGSASAANVYLDVTFTATDFTTCSCGVGGPPPESTVTGEFLILFDPTQTYNDVTTGITLENLNISLGSPLGFNYTPTGTGPFGELPGNLYVGGTSDDAGRIFIPPSPVQDNFYLQIDNIVTTPSFDQLGYTQVAAGQNFYYDVSGLNEGTVSVTNATPEPASVALLGCSLLALGAIRRWGGTASRPR
jgi:hypothetical protein